MKRLSQYLISALLIASAAPNAIAMGVQKQAELFPLSDVRLLDSPFKQAQDTDKDYLLKLNPDSLLCDMRKNVGLAPKAPEYGGWDTNGSGTIGHYLSACSQMAEATGDPVLKQRVFYIVSQLAECQKAGKDGGLYAFAWDRNTYFASLAKGKVIPLNTSAWYLTHKVMAGLRDAYLLCGDTQARDVLIRMSDWADNVTSKLTPAQWQEMMGPPDKMGEYGGPHEVLADVYAMTGDKKYLTLAEKFRHDITFNPVSQGDYLPLNNRHANSEIPKFVGYERIYEVGGEPIWHQAAQNFWDDVASEHTWANGGVGQWEHFFPASQNQDKVNEICGPETCATYNILKLTSDLYTVDPSVRYVDFYERGLYNSILPSQAPGGGFVYYTSMRPGNYRVYSRPYDSFWCCVGTGMENHGKYGEMIYAHNGGRLFVNLFIPSVLTWQTQGLTLRQSTAFPNESKTHLLVSLKQPEKMTISVRCPSWISASGMKIRVNGQVVHADAQPGRYADISRVWKSGDKVDVSLPMHLSSATLPNSQSYTAFYYGPVLLAGEMGAHGLTQADFYGGGNNTNSKNQLAVKTLPISDFPTLAGTAETALAGIHRQPGNSLVFTSAALGAPDGVTLIPFYNLYFQRYDIYWPLTSATDYQQTQKAAADAQSNLVDRVLVGEAPSETEHNLVANNSGTGPASPPYTHWRDGHGWFQYTLKVLPDKKMKLKCSYWGSDGGRVFDILVDGQLVATQQLDSAKPNEYLDITYPVPYSLTKGKSAVDIKFVPRPGSIAGGLFDLQISKSD